jgi:hypothetical protein
MKGGTGMLHIQREKVQLQIARGWLSTCDARQPVVDVPAQ